MNELAEVIASAVKGKEQTGSDYTAKVTKVQGQTAYVQITGSDIADTPVAMSISCKPGDLVRVRVADGKAWVTGNDTSPPTDDSAAKETVSELSRFITKQLSDGGSYSKILQTVDKILLEVGNKMDSDMGNRASTIEITQGLIKFLANTIVVDSDNFTLDENGNSTFGGTLNAAGGTFKGTVEVDWLNVAKILLGAGTNAPIMVKALTGDSVCEINNDIIYVATNGGRTYAQMDYYNGFNWSSDRRIKTDIKEISPELAEQLKPCSFRFATDEENKVRYGFIAQDVLEVMPDAVTQNARSGYYGLSYTEFIAPTLALAQKNAERIAALEAELKELKERLNEHNNI